MSEMIAARIDSSLRTGVGAGRAGAGVIVCVGACTTTGATTAGDDRCGTAAGGALKRVPPAGDAVGMGGVLPGATGLADTAGDAPFFDIGDCGCSGTVRTGTPVCGTTVAGALNVACGSGVAGGVTGTRTEFDARTTAEDAGGAA